MKKNALLFISMSLGMVAAAQQIHTIKPTLETTMKLYRVSPPLSQIKDAVINKGAKDEAPENASLKMPPAINPNALPKGEDAALQKSYAELTGNAASSSIQVLSNWEGSTASVDPSDNCLAVGPSHVVQMVNGGATLMRIWSKSTGQVLANKTVGSIGGGSNIGDPNIIYDAQADRYVLLVIGGTILFSSNLTICVSKTNDPTGQYYVYKLAGGFGLFDPNFPDYPKMGVWGNSYYVTTNSAGPVIWAFDRTSMLAGGKSIKSKKFSLKDFPGGGVQSASPVTVMGNSAPPTNSQAIIMRVFDDAWTTGTDVDNLEIYQMNLDWTTIGNSTMTGPFKLNIAAYDSYICGSSLNAGKCIPQQSSNTKLDALGGIIMDKAQYRNFGTYESIVCSHTSDARGDGVAGVRWYELHRTGTGNWTLFQQGTYAPNDASHRWMGSVAQNQNGAIALGYNISGTTLFPGIRVTARNAGDAAGNMTAAETIAKAGTAANGSYRYGDYNNMVSDITDGSFWFTANYNTGSRWGTNVVHFKVNATSPAGAASSVVMNVYPNPASSFAQLVFSSNEAGNMPLQLMDKEGHVYMERSIQVIKGDNNIKLDIASLPNGIYMVKCMVNGQTASQKLFVQH